MATKKRVRSSRVNDTAPAPGSLPQRPYVRPERRTDGALAFVAEQVHAPGVAHDELPDYLAEGFVTSATSGEHAGDDAADTNLPEEIGGPFVESSSEDEVGESYDDPEE